MAEGDDEKRIQQAVKAIAAVVEGAG
jgi:hypothetical protein